MKNNWRMAYKICALCVKSLWSSYYIFSAEQKVSYNFSVNVVTLKLWLKHAFHRFV